MGMTRSTDAYKDIERALTTALANLPAATTMTFETEAKAVTWRQRASYFRRLQREAADQMYRGHSDPSVAMLAGKSAYDDLVFSKQGRTIVIKQMDIGLVEMKAVQEDGTERVIDTRVVTEEPQATAKEDFL